MVQSSILQQFSTNIGKSFLTILDRDFSKSHKPHEIFNRNNVKISYSSLPNFASIINSNNKKIINNNITKTSAPTCNCHSKTSCLLNGDCLQSSLVYIRNVVNVVVFYHSLLLLLYFSISTERLRLKRGFLRFILDIYIYIYIYIYIFTNEGFVEKAIETQPEC